MNSPARQHFERVRAARDAARAEPGKPPAGASRYELMLAKLAADRRRLKTVQSIARKIEVKRAVLPEYADYVSGTLEGGRGGQDDVLTTVMIWRIDTGDYPGALDIARYALRHRLTLPDHYERSTAAVLAEEFADAALAAMRDGGAFDAAQLEEVRELTAADDMHDPVRAKLHKALGLALMRAVGDDSLPAPADRDRASAAVQALRAALRLDERAGVKQFIARLEKLLSDAAGHEPAHRG